MIATRPILRWCLHAAGFALLIAGVHAAPAPILVMRLDGAIGPAAADYVERGIARAAENGAQLAVLEMDTPGGLDTSMRQIIKAILGSPVPVAAYVAPSGARAASAGTYILYASHVAAMAPGTNLGAATPVAIGLVPSGAPSTAKPDKDKSAAAPADTMSKKAVNDAAAYIRGLAQLRGRNAQWAERAVRESVSLSAADALKLRVADYVVDDVQALAKVLDGKSVNVLGQPRVLATAGAPQIAYEPDWRTQFLGVITNPSIAIVLMLIGVYGIFFEFAHPGLVAPGVVGGIALLVALFAFQLLPVNYAGLALMGFGVALMVAEAFVPSFGTLGIGGVVAFVIGAVMLVDTDLPGFGVPFALVGSLAVVSAALIALTGTLALRARHRPVVSGREEMIGSVGEVLQAAGTGGWARVHSERWQVASAAMLAPGQRVRVTGVDGLTLRVEPIDDKGG